MNESIFQNFLKFEPKLAQIYENFGKIRWFWLKFGKKSGKSLFFFFFEKVVFVWVYFQIPQRYFPTKTKLEYPEKPTQKQCL